MPTCRLFACLLLLAACGEDERHVREEAILDSLAVKFQVYDLDQNGRIDAAEFFRTPQSKRPEPMRLFDRIDADGDGFIDRSEAHRAMHESLGEPHHAPE